MSVRSAPTICGLGKVGVDGSDRSDLETAFFRSAFRTTALSSGNSL